VAQGGRTARKKGEGGHVQLHGTKRRPDLEKKVFNEVKKRLKNRSGVNLVGSVYFRREMSSPALKLTVQEKEGHSHRGWYEMIFLWEPME